MNNVQLGFSKSLTGRLFKLVFGGYVILAVAVTVIQLTLEYSSVQQTISEDLTSIGQSFNGAVTGAMWDIDKPLLKTIAQGIAQSSIVTGVKISSNRGEVFAAIGDIPSSEITDPNQLLTHTQFYTSRLSKQSLTGMRDLGELTVYSDRSIAVDRVMYSFIVILINSLIKTTGLWVIFYFVITRSLSRPLSQLTNVVSQLEFAAESKEPILLAHPDESKSTQDELARLMGAMDKMQLRLFTAREALTKVNLGLEEKVAERTLSLAEALAFNETILHSFPIPIGVYAASGQCVLANHAYGEFVGTTQESLLAENFHNIDSWRESGLLADCLIALSEHKSQKREATMTSLLGKEIWFEYQIIPTLLNGVSHLLVQFFDLTIHKEAEDELRYIAMHDSLTRLPNRRLLLDRISQAIINSKRNSTYGAIIFLDLNEFKLINDTHGHEVGDILLCAVAERLLHVVRESDTVARLGGDEFVVLIEGCHANKDLATEYIGSIVNKIHKALNEEYILKDISHQSSASIGVELFLGAEDEPEDILKKADAAMYKEKRTSLR